MDNRHSTLPLVSGAVFLALIVGVSFWAMRPRHAVAPERIVADDAAAAQVAASIGAAPKSLHAPSSAMTDPGQDLMAIVAANDEAATKLAEAGEQKLRSRYESERVDAGWASRKQQVLERLSISPQIEQLNAQPTSIDARCRASVCLITADFPSQLAATDWHTLYTLNAGTEMSNSSMRSTVNPDGSVRVQIYGLARQ